MASYMYAHEADFQQFGWVNWGLFYFLTIFTMGLAITPTTFIAFVGGYFLAWYSLPFMVPAYLLASLLCYFLSRKVDGGKFVASLRKNPQVDQYLNRAYKSQLSLVIYSKLSPALPFALSNFLLAVMNIRIGQFLLGCFIGMLPRTVLAVWAGQELKQFVYAQANPNQLSLILLLFAISLFGLFRVFKKEE